MSICTSTSYIELLVQDNDNSWHLCGDKFSLREDKESSLALSHNWITNDQLISSLSDGNIVLYGMEGPIDMIHAHSFEAWTAVVSDFSDGKTVFSGGDDAILSLSDFRTGSVVRHSRPFGAGVTSILPIDNTFNLLVGDFNETLSLVDTRTFRAISKTGLGGGVWRLEPQNDQLLACCMHGGARVFNKQAAIDDLENLQFQASLTKSHNSMVYGGCWISGNRISTCSFYDKIIATWELLQ